MPTKAKGIKPKRETTTSKKAKAAADTVPENERDSSALSLIARTHRAFGLFPSALLLLGYGETEIIKIAPSRPHSMTLITPPSNVNWR